MRSSPRAVVSLAVAAATLLAGALGALLHRRHGHDRDLAHAPRPHPPAPAAPPAWAPGRPVPPTTTPPQAPAPSPSATAAPPAPGRQLAATPTAGPPRPLRRLPVAAARSGALPVGKGMWLNDPAFAEGGDVSRIVQRAVDHGIIHLYVRTGSSWMGFYAAPFLDRLLPVAHAAGIRVFGWDFPNLRDWQADVARARAAITYTTPSGDRIDGFAADIETASEGTALTPEAAFAYGTRLRQEVGDGYRLVAVVPNPTPYYRSFYPYPHVVAQFDAVAPMVYWYGRNPVTDVEAAMDHLAAFGKPVIPIGQAYDTGDGPPTRDEILAFMEAAERKRAPGVSFWVWHHASADNWAAIRDASQFVLYQDRVNQTGGRNILVQTLLTSLGYPTKATGDWDVQTVASIRAFQAAAGIPVTGELDGDTRHALLTPVPPPIRPMLPPGD